MPEKFTALHGDIHGAFTFEPVNERPSFDQPTLEELRIQSEYEALQDAYGADWQFHIPITEEGPKQPTVVPLPEPLQTGEAAVMRERNAFGAISANEIGQQPTVAISEDLRNSNMIPVSEDVVTKGLLGIGLVAGAAAIVYRDKLREIKHARLYPKLRKVRESIKMGIFDYALDVEHVLDVVTGKPHIFATKRLVAHVQEKLQNQSPHVVMNNADTTRVKQIATGKKHGARTVMHVFTAMHVLEQIGQPELPASILNMLANETDLGTPDNVSVVLTHAGDVALSANGIVYELNSPVADTAESILKERAIAQAHRASGIASNSDSIEPTII